MKKVIKVVVAGTLITFGGAVAAHGDGTLEAMRPGSVQKEQKPWGIAGDTAKVTRTIDITMLDAMRFAPDSITVKKGQTVRLVITNTGRILHELVIGTKEELDEHAKLMARFSNMEHAEPHMAHVDSGKTGEIVWTFNRAGNFDFRCLIPGHYEAGMVGRIHVAAK